MREVSWEWQSAMRERISENLEDQGGVDYGGNEVGEGVEGEDDGWLRRSRSRGRGGWRRWRGRRGIERWMVAAER